MKCSICIRIYTAVRRRKITCKECNHDVCSCCFVKYIMSFVLAPCCMYCKAPIYICLYKNLISTRKYKDILKLSFEKKINMEEFAITEQNHEKARIHSNILEVIRCNICDKNLVVVDSNILNDPPCLKCVSCETVFCNTCFSPLESDNSSHICVSKIKPCPRCYILIEKEDEGCDQMFCVSCNTVYSWKTGMTVDVSSIHNPHYYQWKRSKGELSRHELDDPREGRFYIKCETYFKDQKIKLTEICKKFGYPSVVEVDKKDFLLNFHRMFLSTLVEVSKQLEREADIRHNLRIHYIVNAISTNLWKRNLRKHFYFINQCEAIKYNILKTLDILYILILDRNSNDTEIEAECFKAVQQTDHILTF